MRHDVIPDFYACLIQMAESHGGTFTITANGKPAYEVTVKAVERTTPQEDKQ